MFHQKKLDVCKIPDLQSLQKKKGTGKEIKPNSQHLVFIIGPLLTRKKGQERRD